MKLKKRLLSKVPVEIASNEYISLAKRIKKEKYLVSADVIQVEENKILLMYFYPQSDLKEGNTKAAFRVFLTKDDYITQDLESASKWKTGALKSLVNGHYWHGWYNECVLVDDKSSEVIKKFIDTREDPLQEIDKLQESIMAKRLSKKHKVIKDRIDKQMEKVPKLPKDFDKWLEYTALFHSRYIYYAYKANKKGLDGYCTHCQSDVIVESPRHNQKGICPKCKSPITYKAMGKSRRVSDRGQATIIQKVDGGILVRYFSLYKDYCDHYKKPSLSYHELSRDFYDKKGKVKNYEWLNFKQTGEERWCDGQGKFGFKQAVLYEKNLDEVLKGTKWEYSGIKEFATHENGFGFPTYHYLQDYQENPSIEYLVKLKLYNLVNEIITRWGVGGDINLKGKNLQEVLNINKMQLTVAQRIDAGEKELNVIREAAKANLNLTDEQILFIAKHLRIERVIEMAKYTTVHKMVKYIKSQTPKNIDVGDTFRDWGDYIKNCKILEYDLKNEFVLFPKDFKEAHDRVYKLVQENKNELFDKAIREMSSKLAEFFNWQYKNYLIVAPRSADEIMKEGQTLHHCVGNYIERVATGETIVLFLRQKEKPEEPYYTIEIDPLDKEIEQCRGKHNKSAAKDIEKIIQRYKKEKLAPLVYKEAV